MVIYGSHWNMKLMIHSQPTIEVDKHVMNISNLELFNYGAITSDVLNELWNRLFTDTNNFPLEC